MNATRQKSPRRILSVSRSAVLLASRNAVLRQAGYEVETTMEDGRALEIMREAKIDAVILGDSIALEQRNHLAEKIRAANERIPIVVLKLADENLPSVASAGMDSLDGPENLLNLLSELLKETDAQAA